MESTRQLKISALIKSDLGDIFQRHIIELAGGYVMVTVTKVYMTKDLSQAKVYLSIFGKEDKNAVIKTIKSTTKQIRWYLSEKIRHQLRIVPELYFFLDDSLDYIEHIDDLLNK
jgi:ribosome-binding factor A